MNYEKNLQKSLDEYQKLKDEYDSFVTSDRFRTIKATMPFDFLKAKYLLEILSLYDELEGKVRLNFVSGDEAALIITDLVKFKKIAPNILEDASYIVEASKLSDKINELVRTNEYLSSSMMVEAPGKISKIASECLEQIPTFKLKKEFRFGFIESCINSLSEPELNKLLAKKIIKSSDLDKISLKGSEKYEKNIAYLAEITGHSIIKKQLIKTLKGVSFANPDGTKRQDLLKALKTYQASGKTPHLSGVFEMFTPDMGAPEPSVRIMWDDYVDGDNTLGFLPREVAENIHKNYKDNTTYKVELKDIRGGGDVAYGIEINFNIIATEYQEEIEKGQEK